MKSKINTALASYPQNWSNSVPKTVISDKSIPKPILCVAKDHSRESLLYWKKKKMMAILVETLLGYMAMYANFLISNPWNWNSDGKLSQQKINLGTVYYINKIHLGKLPGRPGWYFSCFPISVLSIIVLSWMGGSRTNMEATTLSVRMHFSPIIKAVPLSLTFLTFKTKKKK